MRLILIFISILSFIAMPLAQEICCTDSEKNKVEHCDDHESGHNNQTETNHHNDCLKSCCGFVVKIEKAESLDIELSYNSFSKVYYHHFPKRKDVKIKILRPPITQINYYIV